VIHAAHKANRLCFTLLREQRMYTPAPPEEEARFRQHWPPLPAALRPATPAPASPPTPGGLSRPTVPATSPPGADRCSPARPPACRRCAVTPLGVPDRAPVSQRRTFSLAFAGRRVAPTRSAARRWVTCAAMTSIRMDSGVTVTGAQPAHSGPTDQLTTSQPQACS
jgi:hypothetical protein